MKGFFNQKTDFLVQVACQLSLVKNRENDVMLNDPVSVSDDLPKEVLVPVFITKWVDSKTLGFIFQLSDGAVGVLGEDSTKLVITSCENYLEFIDGKGKMVRCCTGPDENSNVQQYPDIQDKLNKLKPYLG